MRRIAAAAAYDIRRTIRKTRLPATPANLSMRPQTEVPTICKCPCLPFCRGINVAVKSRLQCYLLRHRKGQHSIYLVIADGCSQSLRRDAACECTASHLWAQLTLPSAENMHASALLHTLTWQQFASTALTAMSVHIPYTDLHASALRHTLT